VEEMDMNYHVKDILRDAVDTAKQCGIWQLLTMKEKKETVRYIYSILGTIDHL
jgi:hypothetical protein